MTWRLRARAAQVALAFSSPATPETVLTPPLPLELEPIAVLPDELARLEGWAGARAYELVYASEDASRLSMTRPSGALIYQGA